MEKTLEGATNLLGKVGYRAQLLLLGVLLPGALITLEISGIWAFGNDQRRSAIYSWITQDMGHVAVPGLGVLLMALFVAYILRYVARDLPYKLSNAWLRRGLRPNRPASTILAQLRLVHGAAEVDRVVARYQVFALLDPATLAPPLPRPKDFYVREYCKLWLRIRAPALTTDGMEAEINMVVGFVVPVLLGIIPSIVFLPALFGNLTAVLAGVAFALFGFLLFYNINAVRCQETEEAIGNFLVAHWMRLDAPPRPPRGS